MLPKPSQCSACPFFGDGMGFVPDEIVAHSEIVVLLQNPGENEEAKGKPAIGPTGELLNATLLPAAGYERGEVTIANALRCRWTKDGRKTNALPSGKILDEAIAHCRVHDRWPPGVSLVVTCGAIAWKACGGNGTITDWRGFCKP